MLTFKEFLTEGKPSGTGTSSARAARDKSNVQKKGRYELVKARVRSGKIQRRKKVSDTKGYEFKNGKLVRMSAKEKRNRIRGSKKGKFKRKAHLRSSLARRKRSLRKRHSLGL